MSTERFVVVGLARVRSPWFGDVAHWANTSQIPVEFLKCVSVAEVRARLAAGRPISALLIDGGATGLDRDLIDAATARSTAVVVVTDPRIDRDWTSLGANAVLPDAFDAPTLLACLAAHAQAIRSATDALPADLAADDAGSRWRGRLVAVTGGGGAGTSTVAMALAQGLARLPGNTGSVVLADLAGCGDLAMYHDVRDVMPGLQELVEAHRSTTPSRAVVRRLLFDIDERGYSLLLGLRRSRDWTALRPRALDAAVESLRASFRAVVADVRPEFDGEAETGSVDLEERNGPSRVAVVGADAVVVCGDASLKGIHALIRTERDVLGVGVDAGRVLRVVTRASRSPRQRAELARSIEALRSGDSTPRLSTVFLPERRGLDLVHSVAGPLPRQLVDPVTRAASELLSRKDQAPLAATR
jgi:MinD-like ATPase involved in chromosome partitioning or flagellar assembly